MLSFPAASRRRRPLLQRVAFVYCGYALAMFVFQRFLVFPGQFVHSPPGVLDGVPNVERISIDTAAGEQSALFLAATPEHRTPVQRRPLVIFAYGNGESAASWAWALDAYRRMGVSVLIPEYRGYDGAPGSPSESGIVSDFEQFYDVVVTRPDVDGSRIIFHGRSIGGGVITALAARRKPAALILQSTFTSLSVLAHRRWLPGFLLRDPFDSIAVLRQLEIPVLVAHGRRDPIIPFSEGELLAKAAPHSEFVPMECAHNDCPPDWAAFMSTVGEFLTRSLLK